ncbi:MAG: hypothetical protein F6K00_18100 [Leptolyngbya sp. SIOISBB]|nr:hypothetical protein [Leptolyngbya sp. SIOISBB]
MIDSKVPLLDSQSTSESPHPGQMADASADQLMADLFDDVERALEGDEDALEKIAQPVVAEPPSESELTLSLAEGALPAALSDQAAAEGATDLAPVTVDETVPVAPKTTGFWTVNRALLGAAGLMVLATLGVWLQQRQSAEIMVTAPAATPVEAPVAATNAEFLEYLRRSLEVIAQNATTAAPTTTTNVGEVAVALNGANGVGIPPVGTNVLPSGVANGLPQVPGAVNVIERVYVPYPASQVTAGAPSAVSSSVANNPSVSGVAGAPTATQNPQTLLGVLELGDRSAALFEIGGVPQRVYIGERVGNSGWLLVSVANEEAVVRRNGEVRTLYIGQQF